jgi:hypothetical protein
MGEKLTSHKKQLTQGKVTFLLVRSTLTKVLFLVKEKIKKNFVV